MTHAEFAAARQRLALSYLDAAEAFGFTPAVVEAWERGTARVPTRVTRMVAWQLAAAERAELLAASGLPECADAAALERAVKGKTGDDLLAALRTLNLHADACPVCQARAAWIEEHAPPMPELPMPWFAKTFEVVDRMAARLPPWGQRGDQRVTHEGRTAGLGIAVMLSLGVGATLLLRGGMLLMQGDAPPAFWKEPLRIYVLIVPGYIVGFGLAGAIYDALRPIRHTFVGYVLKCGLCTAAIYGVIGLLMPFMDPKEHFGWSAVGIVSLGLGAVGAMAGALLWIIDRVKGKLPRPAA